VDVSVDVVGADPVDCAVSLEYRQDVRLHPRESQRDVSSRCEPMDLGELRSAPGVDEVDPFEIEHEGA
jgi:hypothetical protein